MEIRSGGRTGDPEVRSGGGGLLRAAAVGEGSCAPRPVCSSTPQEDAGWGWGRVAATRPEALQAVELAAIIPDLHSSSLFPKKFCIYPLLCSYHNLTG